MVCIVMGSNTSIKLIDLVTNTIFIETHAWRQYILLEVEAVSYKAVEQGV